MVSVGVEPLNEFFGRVLERLDTFSSIDAEDTPAGPFTFDHNGDGFADRSGPGDGLLARGSNGNGVIDDSGELFSGHVRLADVVLAANRFVELTRLGGDAEGKADEQDAAFASLRVWRGVINGDDKWRLAA